ATRSPKSKVWYGGALLLFALGLMSKPMLVTLPLLMLLLDFWPLQRFQLSTFFRLVGEKIPFLILTAASCLVTLVAQSGGGAVLSLETISPAARVENALLACGSYLAKTFWPVKLAAFYPLPDSPSATLAAC